jgi:hypothetical protein
MNVSPKKIAGKCSRNAEKRVKRTTGWVFVAVSRLEPEGMHFYPPRNDGRFPRGIRRAGNVPFRAGKSHPNLFRAKNRRDREMRRADLTKTQAETLLDWLEAKGCRHFEVFTTSEQFFAVRWWN